MAMALTSSKASTFLTGSRVTRSQPKAQARRASSRVVAPTRAKYGDESQFFDLDDLENTAGSWDLYGQQDERRYPSMQAEFFERAAAPLTRRESVYAFVTAVSNIGHSHLLIEAFLTQVCTAVGFLGIGIWGAKGSQAVQLPITVGPKKGGEKGPRGRL